MKYLKMSETTKKNQTRRLFVIKNVKISDTIFQKHCNKLIFFIYKVDEGWSSMRKINISLFLVAAEGFETT